MQPQPTRRPRTTRAKSGHASSKRRLAIPSGVIGGAIARYHPDTKEWDGSELADRHLGCLAAYADVTFVDKRTLEASRQAKQKSKAFASVVRSIERAADYVTIAQKLGHEAGTTEI
ncbi:hypothetical protein NLM27_42100 [Bradyrhizobium sp. CCGB12]|uniref:hypothetical protein n=1 Tax=Bradyrhizobium sp. CCGB12 TaxID=2949632 RepID=UPI0020B1ED43|nr:hypothetical protein [Bradyrhizobium sp. CCGB12]MCP3395329.1 hypothetical protein [Bradyrhizobium sp. CCGB12]